MKNSDNIIFLDLDDCVIPWGSYSNDYKYDFNVVKNITKDNVETLKKFCDVFNFKIYLSSSWSKMLEITDDGIRIKQGLEYSLDDEINILFEIIKELPIIKVYSKGTREEFIEESLKDLSGSIYIIIDDFDLSDFVINLKTIFSDEKIYFIRGIDFTPKDLQDRLIDVIWKYLNDEEKDKGSLWDL